MKAHYVAHKTTPVTLTFQHCAASLSRKFGGYMKENSLLDNVIRRKFGNQVSNRENVSGNFSGTVSSILSTNNSQISVVTFTLRPLYPQRKKKPMPYA
jgi:hypothetical protein